MEIIEQIIIGKATGEQRKEIINLLEEENLPTADLPTTLEHFFVAHYSGQLAGAIGLEVYGQYALLRSMVVKRIFRNRNIAGQLVEQLEQYAITLGIHEIYLLTETAESYFLRKGYRVIGREDVPSILMYSSEFSHVCPVSAVVMKKTLQLT